MKLTSAQVERTLVQRDAKVVPDGHPMVSQLNGLFGDHTYFLDESGLTIIEPSEAAGAGKAAGQVVHLANWADENLTRLAPHEPEPTGEVVALVALQ